MTIEEHIKQAMAECPLTEQQEGKLLLGLENYLNEIEQVKNLNIPAVSNQRELLIAWNNWMKNEYPDYIPIPVYIIDKFLSN